jgi:hypothetical protein
VNLSRTFEHERARRTLLETEDPAQLRQIALMLLQAWTAQQETIEAMVNRGWLPKP